jgi:hypothetical protein
MTEEIKKDKEARKDKIKQTMLVVASAALALTSVWYNFSYVPNKLNKEREVAAVNYLNGQIAACDTLINKKKEEIKTDEDPTDKILHDFYYNKDINTCLHKLEYSSKDKIIEIGQYYIIDLFTDKTIVNYATEKTVRKDAVVADGDKGKYDFFNEKYFTKQ